MAVTATLDLKVKSTETNDASAPSGEVVGKEIRNLASLFNLTAGIGVGAINLAGAAVRTLASTNETIDLQAFPDEAGGGTLNFATVKMIVFVPNTTTTGQDADIEPASSNGFTGLFDDGIHIDGGGAVVLLSRDGVATSGSSKDITITTNATIEYTLMVFGNS